MARVDAFMLSNFRHGLSDLKQDLLVYFNLVLHTHLFIPNENLVATDQ